MSVISILKDSSTRYYEERPQTDAPQLGKKGHVTGTPPINAPEPWNIHSEKNVPPIEPPEPGLRK